MSGFIVRVIETRELVGFFGADSLVALRDCVDEVCDPGSCEYARLEQGGVTFGRGAPTLPCPEPDENGGTNAFRSLWPIATLTEAWCGALFDDQLIWKRLGLTGLYGGVFDKLERDE